MSSTHHTRPLRREGRTLFFPLCVIGVWMLGCVPYSSVYPTNTAPPSPEETVAKPPAADGTEITPINAAPNREVIVISPQDYTPTKRVASPSTVRSISGMSSERVTLDLREVDMRDALQLFANKGGINIIADPEVHGSVTLAVREARLDQVFLLVLQSHSLGFEQRDDIIRVAPAAKLADESNF